MRGSDSKLAALSGGHAQWGRLASSLGDGQATVPEVGTSCLPGGGGAGLLGAPTTVSASALRGAVTMGLGRSVPWSHWGSLGTECRLGAGSRQGFECFHVRSLSLRPAGAAVSSEMVSLHMDPPTCIKILPPEVFMTWDFCVEGCASPL